MSRCSFRLLPATLGLCVYALFATQANAALVTLTIENIGGATPVTPVFAAFHDGSYNLGTSGTAASAGLERLAELGDTSIISGEFGTAGGRVSATVGGAPIGPGGSATHDFTVDLAGGTNSWLSLASMVLPSNDYFLGTVAPSAAGPFGIDLSGLVAGGAPMMFTLSTLYDAGTEENDFDFSAPPNPAVMFGGPFAGLQASNPPGGVDENGTIQSVAAPFASFANAPVGFTNPGVSSLQVTVSAVPEPGSGLLIGAMMLGCVVTRRRRK